MTPFVLFCNACGLPMARGDHTECARQPVYVYDHVPHDSEAARATMIDTITEMMIRMNITAPINTPAPVLPPRVKFGGYDICSRCRMAAEFCGCAKQRAPDVQSQDGAESSLEKRARECMGK